MGQPWNDNGNGGWGPYEYWETEPVPYDPARYDDSCTPEVPKFEVYMKEYFLPKRHYVLREMYPSGEFIDYLVVMERPDGGEGAKPLQPTGTGPTSAV